jgi:CubicO group peptidase (beta-lactamase class C family)
LFEKDDFIQRFCNGDLTHNPGELYSYSNAGHVILGRIIEKVTNSSNEQNFFDRITQPLGMTNTGYNNPPKTCGTVYPNGEIQKGE